MNDRESTTHPQNVAPDEESEVVGPMNPHHVNPPLAPGESQFTPPQHLQYQSDDQEVTSPPPAPKIDRYRRG